MQVYPGAKAKYEEGKTLLGINTTLAQDDFNDAEKTLAANQNAFPKSSDEGKQMAALKQLVDTAMSSIKNGSPSETATEVTTTTYLNIYAKNSDALYAGTDGKNYYFISSKGIFSSNADGTNTKQVVKATDSVKNPGGLGVYNGNIYVLDKDDNTIVKYKAGSDGFGKASYLPSGTKVNFSNATGVAIDGSVYVLNSNGNIDKFTRGSQNDFKVSGVSTPFASATRIFTTPDSTHIYILDKGTSRVVVLNKDGSFANQYSASVLKDGLDIDVSEANKTLLVFSSSKVYKINLQ